MGLPKSVLPAPAAVGVARVAGVVAAAVAATAMGGCSGADPTGTTSAPSAPIAASVPIVAPPRPPDPAPQVATAPSPDSMTPGAPSAPVPKTCDTVHAENGPNPQVVNVSASGADCAEAMRILRNLVERSIHLPQAGSGGAVSVSVRGWVCVSGPQTGGTTTCSYEEKTNR